MSKEEFAPYRTEIELCECADCRGASDGLGLPWKAEHYRQARAALLAKLHAGEHVHMTLAQRAVQARAEKAKALEEARQANYSPGHIATIERGFAAVSMRDFYRTGMGVGMTPGMYEGSW